MRTFFDDPAPRLLRAALAHASGHRCLKDEE
jgi:hypothetical protein